MKRYSTIAAIIIVFCVSLLTTGLVGYSCGCKKMSAGLNVKCDTLLLYDTVRITEPVEVLRTVTQERLVYVHHTDTLERTDTLYLPKEVKVYEDSSYRCQVSGVMPSLDWIEVYQKERIITKTTTSFKPYRWGIGIQAGYGATIVDSKLRGVPYIGIGISWNFLTF